MPNSREALTELIRTEIAASGPLTFARFMELALYHPVHGYYRRSLEQIGCQGDFYTSVSVGPVFGQLLACQFSEWLQELPNPRFHLLEAGAHDGRLALDILSTLQARQPDLLQRLEYWILENQPWFEWRVAWETRRFVWARGTAPHWTEIDPVGGGAFWNSLPAELRALLPEGLSIELCPKAQVWWTDAATRLRLGKLLIVDYGLESIEFLAPHRQQGTLRAYQGHRLEADPLLDPGSRDLTAHVNFTALVAAGEKAGLETEFIGAQGAFLTGIAARGLTSLRTRSERAQFQTLTHPNYFGQTFRVLIQGKKKTDST
jgi:SAM-dependent MidA family methyltransferase